MSLSQADGKLQNVRVNEGFELNRSRDIEDQLMMFVDSVEIML